MAERQPIHPLQQHNAEVGTKVRPDMGRMRTLDAETYMAKYPGYTFFWKEQNNGDVDRWLDQGAELVAEASNIAAREVEGYTRRKGSTYVCRTTGFDQGDNTQIMYLMMLPEAEYYRIKLGPERERNALIASQMNRSREAGEIDSDSRGDSTLDTYAPNLPTGGIGFEQVKE